MPQGHHSTLAGSVSGGIDAPMQYYQQYLMPQGHHLTLAGSVSGGIDAPIQYYQQYFMPQGHHSTLAGKFVAAICLFTVTGSNNSKRLTIGKWRFQRLLRHWHRLKVNRRLKSKVNSGDLRDGNCSAQTATPQQQLCGGEISTGSRACGLYYRLHHIERPLELKKKAIQTRKRFFLWVPGIVVLGLWYCFGDMFNGCKKESVGWGTGERPERVCTPSTDARRALQGGQETAPACTSNRARLCTVHAALI
ncbi:hypothetical protein GPALN_003072 [Globodera pallida]|nr:hypothetical protein GPALN_003072 [Globodera pallida]